MLHRNLLLVAGVAAVVLGGCTSEDPYTGEPYARNRRVEVRRRAPTPEEIAVQPPTPYEQQLRAADAKAQRLAVPRDVRDRTRYFDESSNQTREVMGPGFGPRHDPWQSYEEDRKRVLVREWADVGKPSPVEPDPTPRKEPVLEDDPFAPAPALKKKDEGDKPVEGDKPAEGDKKPDADKPAEPDKKGE